MPARRPKALVVDDEESNAALVRRVLAGAGYDVESTTLSRRALVMIERTAYDVVIADVKMPELSGQELYGRVCQIRPEMARRFIFITGDIDGEDTREFLDQSRCSYFMKPFNLERLTAAVDMLTGSRAPDNRWIDHGQDCRLHQRQPRSLLDEMKRYLAIPSISALPEHKGDVRKCAEWTADEMRRIGLQNVRLEETPGHPVVYGEWLGAPGAPTILFYGHYDVQPVDPVNLWTSPPFEATIRDGEIYARGSADDKGQVFMHFKADRGAPEADRQPAGQHEDPDRR